MYLYRENSLTALHTNILMGVTRSSRMQLHYKVTQKYSIATNDKMIDI